MYSDECLALDMVDRARFEELLELEFSADQGEVSAVAEQALELASEGSFEGETGHELHAELIVTKLHDANKELIAGWNWWMDELEFLFGGYDKYKI